MPETTGNNTIMRYQIADYLNTGTAEAETYSFMGTGYNTLDENFNPQTESKTYVSDKSASNTVKSYQAQFPFDADFIKSEEAINYLYGIGRNHKTGVEAETDYVRVELFEPVADSENTFKARKFRVSVEVTNCTGEGGSNLKLTGNLNGVGNFIDGTFNTTTKMFTATE